MKLTYRRVFFYLYLALFFLIAPLVVLYTAGYRYQWTTGQLVHTGAIAINSLPKNAAVWLNNHNTGRHTTTLLQHLMPGTYQLRLTKEGYHSWERDIEISSRQTAQIEQAVLFVDAAPTLLLPLSAEGALASPDGSLLAYGTRTEPWFELWIYRFTDATYTLLDRLPTAEIDLTQLRWAQDSQSLTLDTHTYTISENAKTPSIVFHFSKDTDGIRVIHETTTGPQTVAVLPDGTYRLVQMQKPYALLQEPTHDRFVLIDTTTNGPPILLNTNAAIYAWNEDVFYYSDGLELHRYWISSNRNELITRTSESLKGIVAFPQGQTVLMVYSTTVIARDLSDLAHPINTPLITADRIDQFWIDQRGRTGYFVGSLNGQEGVFSLALTK